jgi:hypothetical protein
VWAIFFNLIQYHIFYISLREGKSRDSRVSYNDLEGEDEGGFDIPTLECPLEALGAQNK